MARTTLNPNDNVPIGGQGAEVFFAATGTETIRIDDGTTATVTGFQRGGEIMQFEGPASDYDIVADSNNVTITGPNGLSISFAVGSTAGTIRFADGADSRSISFTNGAVVFGGQTLTNKVVTDVEPGAVGAYSVAANDGATIHSEGTNGTPNTVTYTVTRADATAAESLVFTVNGDTNGGTVPTAIPGQDFTQAAASVNFLAGQKTATFTVDLNADLLVEGVEGYKISVFNSKNQVVASSVQLIQDATNANNVGQTFQLTNGQDTMPGLVGSGGSTNTNGDDTVISNDGTLGVFDNLDTGTGKDKVQIFDATGDLPSFANVKIVNAEGIEITAVGGFDGNALNTTGFTGLQTFSATFTDNSNPTTLTFKNDLTDIKLSNAGTGGIDVVGGGGALSVQALTNNDINVGQTVVDNEFTSVKTVGGDDVNITDVLIDANDKATLASIDVSGFSDNVTVNAGALSSATISGNTNTGADLNIVNSAASLTVSLANLAGGTELRVGKATELTVVTNGAAGTTERLQNLLAGEQTGDGDPAGPNGVTTTVNLNAATNDLAIDGVLDTYNGPLNLTPMTLNVTGGGKVFINAVEDGAVPGAVINASGNSGGVSIGTLVGEVSIFDLNDSTGSKVANNETVTVTGPDGVSFTYTNTTGGTVDNQGGANALTNALAAAAAADADWSEYYTTKVAADGVDIVFTAKPNHVPGNLSEPTLSGNGLTGGEADFDTDTDGSTPILNVMTKFTGGSGADSIFLGATKTVNDLGGGDDTVFLTVPALGAGGAVNGGAGKDTLQMSAGNAAAITAAANGLSNFDVLSLQGQASAQSSTINLANAGFTAGAPTYVQSYGASAQQIKEQATFTFNGGNTTAGDGVTFDYGGDDTAVIFSAAGLTPTQQATEFAAGINADAGSLFSATSNGATVTMTRKAAGDVTPDLNKGNFVLFDAGTKDLSISDPVTTVQGSSGGITLNNFSNNGGTLELAGAGTGGIHTISQAAGAGAADDITIALSGNAMAAAGTVNAQGYETLKIDTGAGTATKANLFVANTFGAIQDVVTVLDTSAKVITVTGNENLYLITNSTALTTIDTTASKGALYLNTGTFASTGTIKLGGDAGVSNIVVFTGTKDVAVTGNVADDTVAINGGNGAVSLGAGNDTVFQYGSGGFAGVNLITTGTGSDAVLFGHSKNGLGFSTVSDFDTTLFTVTLGQATAGGDVFGFSNGALGSTVTAFNKTAVTVGNPGNAVFQDYLDAAANTTTVGSVSWFQFGGDTYVVQDNTVGVPGDSTFQNADNVARFSGLVDLSVLELGNGSITLMNGVTNANVIGNFA